jgi:hypothetical protein
MAKKRRERVIGLVAHVAMKHWHIKHENFPKYATDENACYCNSAWAGKAQEDQEAILTRMFCHALSHPVFINDPYIKKLDNLYTLAAWKRFRAACIAEMQQRGHLEPRVQINEQGERL